MFTSECEKPDSQMAKKQTKKKLHETPNALVQQNLAATEHKDFKVRKFRKEQVLVETIGGQPISVDVWASNEKPSIKRKIYDEIQDVYICEVCRREFDEKRKLLIHARCHKKKETASAPNTNVHDSGVSTQGFNTDVSAGAMPITESCPTIIQPMQVTPSDSTLVSCSENEFNIEIEHNQPPSMLSEEDVTSDLNITLGDKQKDVIENKLSQKSLSSQIEDDMFAKSQHNSDQDKN